MLTLRLLYTKSNQEFQTWIYELSGPHFSSALFNVSEEDCRELRSGSEDVAYRLAIDLLKELNLNHLTIEVQ